VRTFSAKPGEFVRTWYVIDATDQVLGRLASRAAHVLRGKHKPVFTPHVDAGDFVIVINAEKVKLTGNKLDGKMYVRHSEYPGGFSQVPYRRLLETHPERAVERAVKGMLPHNTLGRSLLRKLKVYAGPGHPHESQKPQPLSVDGPIPLVVERVPARTPKPRAPKAKPAARKPAARKAKPAPRRTSRRTTESKES
jgi:large subunit ribosomal protein L13